VFLTDHDGVKTIWLIQMLDTPDDVAGTVRVSCDDKPHGGCVVSVTYDMSLLPGADPTALDPYDQHAFDSMMLHWSHAIRHHA